MRKRFFLASVLAALLTSTGCEAWLHHHGYYPSAAAPAYAPQQYCVPCVPYPPAAPAAYPPPAAVPSWNAPVASAPAAAGTCCCPAPGR